MRNDDSAAFNGNLPSYAFYECPDVTTIFTDIAGWVWFLWLFSQFWTTVHVWNPKSIRLAATEQMFGTPYYCGLLPEQSYMLNRRSDSGEISYRIDVRSDSRKSRKSERAFDVSGSQDQPDGGVDSKTRKISKFGSSYYEGVVTEEDKIVRVYGCATMWHENSEEMAEMLKSIFRMDEDYAAR